MPTEKLSVHLPDPMVAWLTKEVEKGRFASMSHGIRYCVQQTFEIEADIKKGSLLELSSS